MAYDKAKAHEYYLKYRKKGLLKGRKKGTAVKTSTKKKGKSKKTAKGKQENLVGLSTAGLNDAGRMQAALTKDKLKKEMNEKLAKETDPAKRDAIRNEYQQKALAATNALKNDPTMAKAKASGKSGGSKGSSKSGGKGSSGGSKDKGEEGTDKQSKTSQKSTTNANMVKEAKKMIDNLRKRLLTMTADERAAKQEQIKSTIKAIEELIKNAKK